VAYLNIAFGRRSISTAINFLLKLLRGVLLQASTGSFTELTLFARPKENVAPNVPSVHEGRTTGQSPVRRLSRPLLIYGFHGLPGKRPKGPRRVK
jgi:hypothetical protein